MRALSLAIVASSTLAFACVSRVDAQTVPAPVVTRIGGSTIITQDDESAPLVHVTYTVAAGLDRQTLAQNGVAAVTAQTILSTPIDGETLADRIAADGGHVNFIVDADDVRFNIEAIPGQFPTVLNLFAQGVAKPDIGNATVAQARTRVQTLIAQRSEQPLQVGIEMLAPTLGGFANAALPPLGLPQIVAQTVPTTVQSFYTTYYRRGGTYVSAVGPLAQLPASTLPTLAAALPDGTTQPVAVQLPPLSGETHQIVTHRDVPAPWLVAAYRAPDVASNDFGAMLILASFMQRTLADIVQMPDVVSPTYVSSAVGSSYRYDAQRPSLVLFVNGSVGSPDRAFATALSVAGVISQTKLQGSIDTFKTLALGDFIGESSDLQTRAYLPIVFAREGVSPDYIAHISSAIGKTQAADLQRVAKAYLLDPAIALVLPNK